MSDAWRMVVRAPGGPEVMEREAMSIPVPGADEIVVRNSAIDVNFIDIYHRTGLYPRAYPSGIGQGGAGEVVATGVNVHALSKGDRVVYLNDGSYATHALASADRAFRLPEGLDAEIAAASLLKGLTSWMLIEKCARVVPGQSVLVHAAAGGVGSIAVQWLKAAGATVIAHSGTAEKADIASRLGADHSLCGPLDALAQQVRALTDGRGVDAVLDGVGAASWDASIGSIARRGIMISYGNASGPVPPVAPLVLTRAGSIFLTRPTLFDWIERAGDRDAGWQALSAMLVGGEIRIDIGQRFPLADAASAHRALEARQTTGSTLLIPS